MVIHAQELEPEEEEFTVYMIGLDEDNPNIWESTTIYMIDGDEQQEEASKTVIHPTHTKAKGTAKTGNKQKGTTINIETGEGSGSPQQGGPKTPSSEYIDYQTQL